MNARRQWLAHLSRLMGAAAGLGVGSRAHAAAPSGLTPLSFPRDFGAHLEARIEWWYVTGVLRTQDARAEGKAAGTRSGADSREFGFQITFFRSRTPLADRTDAGKSRLSAPHLLFAHAALTDVQAGELLHAERLSRWNGRENPAAQASTEDTDLRLDRWHLKRQPEGDYRARWDDADAGFALGLQLRPTQPVLLQGQAGYSAKSHRPGHYSHYYSQPHLEVLGDLRLRGQALKVQGRAWLDHEWSSALLDPDAVGWDWVGLNLDDGSALTVFRLRRSDGQALFAGGSLRRAGQAVRAFSPQEVQMQPGRTWRSPRTGATYPVEWTLRTPAGVHRVAGVIDNQELDSRASTGTVYWEGLSRVTGEGGQSLGMGYLEMTGYAARLLL